MSDVIDSIAEIEIPGEAGLNKNEPVRDVIWYDLKPADLMVVYRSECPFCTGGLLCVGRDKETLELEEYDYCMLCGQPVRYSDIEKMRELDHGNWTYDRRRKIRGA